MPLSRRAAEAITVEIVALGETYIEKVKYAFTERIHVALGYDTWQAYVADRLRGLPRLSAADRRELAPQLAAIGMSTVQAAPVLGVSQATAWRDTQPIQMNSPTCTPAWDFTDLIRSFRDELQRATNDDLDARAAINELTTLQAEIAKVIATLRNAT